MDESSAKNDAKAFGVAPLNQMGFFYVPQGRAAILFPHSADFGVTGLFTDNFSTCNILIIFHEDRCFLFHIDANMLLAIKALLEELQVQGANAVLMFKSDGKRIANALAPELSRLLKLTPQQVNDGTEGVKLIYDNGSMRISTTTIENTPDLLFHPNHRSLVTVRAIEQIVGKRTFKETRETPHREIIIFNGQIAINMAPSEFAIDETHTLTKGEMDGLRKRKSFFELLESLAIIKRLSINTTERESFESKLEHYSFTVQCLEDYVDLFESTPESFFHRNMIALYCDTRWQPDNDEDKEHKQKFLLLLEDSKSDIAKIFTLYEQCKESSPYIKHVLILFRLFQEHFKRRTFYLTHEYQLQHKLTTFMHKYELAKKELDSKNFEAAANLFNELNHESSVIITNCHPLYLKIQCNFGRALLGIKEYSVAKSYLEFALSLCKRLFPNKNPEKYVALIMQCDAALTPGIQATGEQPSPTSK